PLSVEPAFADGLLGLVILVHTGQWDRRKHARSLSINGIKGRRKDTQGSEDGRRHLGGAYFGADRLGLEARVGQQQNDIRVVMGEPAMLGQLLAAARVSNADVRGHDDVRRARVYGWVVVVKRKRRAVVDLPQVDSGRGGIRFEDLDGS